jgi:2-oxoglutarate dehydrogenase E2 component (dihydrolipoamide succinyltransferase)
MPVEVRVPVLGESVVEATVGAWLKHEGEVVEAGESLVQLETDKVNVDVAADQAGVLGKIARQEGETVHPGDVLGPRVRSRSRRSSRRGDTRGSHRGATFGE